MKTYVQMINAVLQRLRETEVTDFDDNEYSVLISHFVNDAKREVELAWDWKILQHKVTVTTAASTYSYNLTGTRPGTRIKRDAGSNPDVYRTTSGKKTWLTEATSDYVWESRELVENPQSDAPEYYAVTGWDPSDSDKLTIEVGPTPDGVYTLVVSCVTPQAPLAASSDVILVPDDVVILRAYQMALSERGEDGGQRWDETGDQFKALLADYISIDMSFASAAYDWRVQ